MLFPNELIGEASAWRRGLSIVWHRACGVVGTL